ncbi:MAG: hypothetical protein U0361_22925 [Nitrospiraceae bacterium]
MKRLAFILGLIFLCAMMLAPLFLFAQEFEQVNTNSPQTLENKTLTAPSISSPYISGTVTGTPTIPSATLSNPTITGNVGGGATYVGPGITSPTVSGTVGGGATYTAPTLSSPTITGTVPGSAAYSSPTLNDATLVNPKQFGATIKTIEGFADVATAASNCVNMTLVVTTPSTVVSSNVSFGDTCLVWFMGGSFSFNANISANIAHLMASPYYPIFTGAGCTTSTTCVNFTRGRTVYPEWWGAYAGASASVNQAGGILAINSLPSGAQGGGIVLWSVGTYDHNSTFYSNSRYVTFRGMGMYSTKLRQTTTASLRHGLSCSGSTGYIGVEDIEISPSAVLTSDLGMKAVNFNSDEGAAGGVACSPATASILHVERFKSNGYNFGVYGDGGDSILIQRGECVNCTIKVHGAGGASISESIVFQRMEWGITDKSDLSCDVNTCDHAIYAIHVQHVRTTHSKISGFNDEGIKYITNNAGGKPDPVDWVTQDNEFRSNGSDSVYTVDGGYTLEQAVYQRNRHFSTGLDSLTSAYFQAINSGNIRSCECDGNFWEGVQAQAVKVEASAGSTFDYANLTNQTVKTFSASATNTYVAINYGGAGTMRYAKVGGFFDGGTYGKRAHALMQGGTGFLRVDTVGLYEINMAGGATPPSPNVLQQEMGGSAIFAPSLQRAYCTTTATGTDANTSEKDLATFDLPANLFFTNNAGVWLEAWGTTAANANNKTMKLYFGGSSLVTNSVNPSPNNLGWMARATVHRRGSGSQSYWATMTVGGNLQGTGVNSLSVTDTSAITVKATGQNGTGNANEIVLQGFCVYFVPPYPIW